MTADLLDQGGSTGEGGGWPLPAEDGARVAALRSYGVLDQPPSADLEAAARIAAHLCGAPQAAVNLIDAERQWQAAAYGAEPREIGREAALCAHVVTGTDVVHVEDASRDPRFAASPLVAGPLGSIRLYAAAPLVNREGYALGTVSVFADQPGRLSDEQLGLLRDVAGQVMALLEMRRLAATLAKASSRDTLTGLANRRSAEQAIALAIARAERGLGTPSVVMVDLDGFQAVNEAFGHSAGDSVLRKVADRLRSTARLVDTVARVGGDQFVVLLEHTGGPGATAALGRLRASLQDIGSVAEAGSVPTPPVTASLGMATYRPGDSVASLLSRADAEMYSHKAPRPSGF